jgi:ketosteroid isomerase-like protein
MTTSASIADVVPSGPGAVLEPGATPAEPSAEGAGGPFAGGPASLGHRFSAAVASGDLEAIVALYAADAVVTLPHGREAAGTEAIRAAFGAALEGGADLHVESVGRPIVSGSLACTTTTDAAGRVHTQVARHEPDGAWRWIRDVSRLRESADRGCASLG